MGVEPTASGVSGQTFVGNTRWGTPRRAPPAFAIVFDARYDEAAAAGGGCRDVQVRAAVRRVFVLYPMSYRPKPDGSRTRCPEVKFVCRRRAWGTSRQPPRGPAFAIASRRSLRRGLPREEEGPARRRPVCDETSRRPGAPRPRAGRGVRVGTAALSGFHSPTSRARRGVEEWTGIEPARRGFATPAYPVCRHSRWGTPPGRGIRARTSSGSVAILRHPPVGGDECL